MKKALIIAEKLSLNPEETLHFLEVTKRPIDDVKDKSEFFNTTSLSVDTFEIIGNWYCFAIMNLSECIGFSWSKDYIVQKLDITFAEARDALDRLERVGLIKKNEEGSYQAVSDFVMGPNQISSAAIRKSHYDLLHKAIDALEEKPIEERNITGVGLAISENEYQSLTKEITAFRKKIIKKYGLSKEEKNKVYQLEIALFELTKGKTND